MLSRNEMFGVNPNKVLREANYDKTMTPRQDRYIKFIMRYKQVPDCMATTRKEAHDWIDKYKGAPKRVHPRYDIQVTFS